MGEMATLSRAGDVRIIWNPDNAAETAAAKKSFDDLTKKGHLAFAVKKTGDKGDQIREFDPDAEKIILAPPMRGG
jgi:hypothetical protein